MGLLDLLDPDEVGHGLDHAPDLGTVLLDHHVVDPLEAERAQRLPLVLLRPDLGSDLGDLQPCHYAPTPARAASMAAGATSSTGRPRRAATASGDSSFFRAATVACTMLIAFDEPRLFDSTSWMPAHSSTARTGPPAMTPVPAEAGLSNTTPAASSPITGCGIDAASRRNLEECFFVSSTPFAN